MKIALLIRRKKNERREWSARFSTSVLQKMSRKEREKINTNEKQIRIFVNKMSFAPFSREIISYSYMLSFALLSKINATKKRRKETKEKKLEL